MNIRRGRIHAQIHAQRLAGLRRLLELRLQIFLADNFRRALFQVGDLLVNRFEFQRSQIFFLESPPDRGSVRQPDTSILGDWKRRIPGDLPRKIVRVGKISRIAAPKSVLRGLQNSSAGRFRLGKNRVHLVAAARIIGERYSSEAAAFSGDIRVLRKFRSRVECQRHPARLEENNAFGFLHRAPPSEAFVEIPAALEVRNAQRHNAYALFHRVPPGAATNSPARAAPQCGSVLPGRCAPPRCRCDAPRAGSARRAFPPCRGLRSPPPLASRSAPRPDFHPRNAPCSPKISRRAPAPAAAIPAPETRAAATDEYSECAADIPSQNRARATACIPPGKPDPHFSRAAPPPPACRRRRAPAPST